jgi:hypothetical protein
MGAMGGHRSANSQGPMQQAARDALIAPRFDFCLHLKCSPRSWRSIALDAGQAKRQVRPEAA